MRHVIQVNSSTRNELIDITTKVQAILTKSGKTDGIITLFVPHTTAALTINENADDDVKHDLIFALNKIASQMPQFKHLEGNSDAHVKTTLVGITQCVPYENGKLSLGIWQGIYLCEFDGPRRRNIYVIL